MTDSTALLTQLEADFSKDTYREVVAGCTDLDCYPAIEGFSELSLEEAYAALKDLLANEILALEGNTFYVEALAEPV